VELVLGILGGIAVLSAFLLWRFISWKHRREEEKEKAAEADRRSIRSHRGSVLLMREMSTDAIRNHLSELETKEGGGRESSQMLPKYEDGRQRSPAELPDHFPRSHSRIFEVE
jgi:Flp pilus assembly protein TadB